MAETKTKKEKAPVTLAMKVGDEIHSINEIGIEYIKDYCTQHKTEAAVKAFVKDVILAEPKPDKNGTLRKPTAAQIRSAFVEQFIPELRPKRKAKGATVYDWAADFLKD